jgi:phospholipase A-2-activating protein
VSRVRGFFVFRCGSKKRKKGQHGTHKKETRAFSSSSHNICVWFSQQQQPPHKKMQVDWELSQSLTYDSQGIRAACVLPPSNGGEGVVGDAFRIVTGNQGGGLCAFGVPSGSLTMIDYQHDHGVTALLAGEDVYVTGCKDGRIRVFDPSSHQLLTTLAGHEKPVTSLAWASTGSTGNKFLVSGSWDGTAKVWNVKTGAMMATLADHENSVCVAGLLSNDSDMLHICTGSAGMAQNNQISGHSIRIWTVNVKTSQTACIQTVANDHQGPIRGVCALLAANSNSNLLASCSNDGTVKLRSAETGDCISTLTFLQQQSHPPMLLSVVPLEDNSGIAASAEDGHVVVWDQLLMGTVSGSQQQGPIEPQILLHAATVWNVAPLPNGDLATCCQDGTLRIFTRSSERMAPTAAREQFAQTVQEAHNKKQSGPSAEEIAKLPLWETNLQKRGTSEGQVQLFNKGGIAIAAQWSMASQTWIEVGQVMGSADTGLIDGVKYDHVLPIEVDQTGGGVAKLEIGYNNGENTFVAAQRFIDSHVLPQHHLNAIADYIQQRVGQQATTLGGPAGTATTTGAAAAAAGPTAMTGMPMASFQYLPMSGYKSFELPDKAAATMLEKMKNKIAEFGKLSDAQLSQVSSLMDTLAATNRYHASKVQEAELTVISEMLQIFPPEQAFPALDLARMTVLHPDAASISNSTYWTKILTQAVSLSKQTDDGLEGPGAVAISMLSLRLFANAFRGGPGSLAAAVSHLDAILTCTLKFLSSKNKNVRLSVATVLYNVSFYLHSSKEAAARPEIATQVVGAVDKILSARTYETEALTRALVALGTIVMASKEAKEAAKILQVVSKVEMAASPHGDMARNVAKEVYNVVS